MAGKLTLVSLLAALAANAATLTLDTATTLLDLTQFTPGVTYYAAFQLNGTSSQATISTVQLGGGAGIDRNPADLTGGIFTLQPSGNSPQGLWQPSAILTLSATPIQFSALYSQAFVAGNAFSFDFQLAGGPTAIPDQFAFQLYSADLSTLLYDFALDVPDTSIPEPSTIGVTAAGLIALACARKRRSLLSLFLLVPVILPAQIVLPLVDCIQASEPAKGQTTLGADVPAGSNSLTLSQAVQAGAVLTLNPGTPTEEVVLPPSNSGIPFAAIQTFSSISALQFSHSAGEPVLWEHRAYIAHFGYFNPTTSPATHIPGSSTNFFSPGNPNRGQPSTFLPGVYPRVFSLEIAPNRDLIWILGSPEQYAVARATPALFCKESLPTTPVITATPPTLTRGATHTAVPLATFSSSQPVTATVRPFRGGMTAANPTATTGIIRADITIPSNEPSLSYVDVRLIDSAGVNIGGVTVPVTVVGSCPATFTPQSLNAGSQGTPYPAVTFTASNGSENATSFSLTGALPVGMQFNAAQLSGTPQSAGSFPLQVTANFPSGCIARNNYTLTIGGPACSENITAQTAVTFGGFRRDLVTQRWSQTLSIRNNAATPFNGPIAVALDNLSPNATLFNANGTTACAAPLGRPFINVNPGPDGVFSPGEVITATLIFTNSATTAPITYTPRVLAGGAQQ